MNECLLESGESDEPVDKRILYILKIFAKVAEKPRKFLEDFQSAYEECLRLITEILEHKMMEASEARTGLLDGELNMKEDYKKFES